MLMGAFKSKSVPAQLITGQTWVLSYLFGEGCESFADQAKWLTQNADIPPALKQKWTKPASEIAAQMQTLYRKIVPMTSRRYFNSGLLESVGNWLQAFSYVEKYFLDHTKKPSPFILKFSERILKQEPDVVGFSINLRMDPVTAAIISHLKNTTDLPIVLGGSCFSQMEKDHLQDYLELWADYLVIGPAEKTIVDLLAALETGASLEEIANIAFMKDGQPVFHDCQPGGDMNQLAFPDFSEFDLDKYLTPEMILPIQTSRGCAWAKCAFCQHPIGNLNVFQTMRVESVVELLEDLQGRYGVHHFTFNDSDVVHPRARRIAAAILDSSLRGQINIYMYCRFDSRFNDTETMSLLSEAGIRSIHWGMESSNQRVLDLMNKGIDASDIKPILKKAAHVGISNQIFAFFGFPGETLEEARETADFLLENSTYIETSTQSAVGLFVLGVGSDIYHHPEKYGIHILENNQFDVTSGMTVTQAHEFKSKFERFVNSSQAQLSAHHLKYTSMTNLSRMKFFLCAAHRQLKAVEVETILEHGDFDQIVPLIGGELCESEVQFLPVNFKESVKINNLVKDDPYLLTTFEARIIKLANGERFLADILTVLEDDFNLSSDISAEKALGFLKDVFMSGWALAFSKPWSARKSIEPNGVGSLS